MQSFKLVQFQLDLTCLKFDMLTVPFYHINTCIKWYIPIETTKSFLTDLFFKGIFCYIDRKSVLINYQVEMVSSQTEKERPCRFRWKWEWPFDQHEKRYILRNVGTFFCSNWTRHTKIQKVLDKTLFCVYLCRKTSKSHSKRCVIPSTWTIYSRTLNENLYQLNRKIGRHKSNVCIHFKCDLNRLAFLPYSKC